MTFYVLIFALSFILLARSSDFLVRSLTFFGRLFSLSEYAIAFLFMSMATSMPELFVGVSSAIKGISDFSLGAVLGSSLVNLTLAVGLTVFLGNGLKIESKISRRNFWIIFGLSFFPLLLATDGVISRGDGLILLLLFVFYISQLKKEEEYFTKTVKKLPKEKIFNVFRQLLYFFVALFVLVASSSTIVWAGQSIAEGTAISLLSMGLVFAALGTSLPEIAFGVRARILGHDSMAIGNSLGSNAFNSTLIVGVASFISPISISFSADLVVITTMLFVAYLFFNFFVFSKSVISRREGLMLLLVYFVFIFFEFLEYFTDVF